MKGKAIPLHFSLICAASCTLSHVRFTSLNSAVMVWHLLVFGCPGFFVGVHYRNITAFSFVIKLVTVENDKGHKIQWTNPNSNQKRHVVGMDSRKILTMEGLSWEGTIAIFGQKWILLKTFQICIKLMCIKHFLSNFRDSGVVMRFAVDVPRHSMFLIVWGVVLFQLWFCDIHNNAGSWWPSEKGDSMWWQPELNLLQNYK